MRLRDLVEPVYVARCSRCHTEGLSYHDTPAGAERMLTLLGWTVADAVRTLCPDCTTDLRHSGRST